MTIDGVVLALIAETLTSYVREMRTAIIRTSFSPMMHEGHDFSCAILSPQGELIAASEVDQPTHLSALPWSARSILKRYGATMADGDLFLFNDPYAGGTHLNDVVLIKAVFADGQPLVLAAVMAHWQDIGGMVPGSLTGTATEIFQEGIRIPPVRIRHEGVEASEVLDLLFTNVRDPADRAGDLRAMEGACLLAEKKLHALAVRRGTALLKQAMAALLDRAEQRMRAAIAALPDGVYRCETHLDNTGESPEPLTLKIRLTIEGDQLEADFTGCPPQVAGPMNLGPASATTAVFTMTKAFLDPHGPINAGGMRPLRVMAPEGTMLNAGSPAACGAIGEVRRALEGLVMGAFGRVVSARAVGDMKGASNITTIACPGRLPFVEFPAGGTGAWAASDGNNAMRNFAEGDLSSIQPAEAIELRWPLRVERLALRVDSGGAGKRRGGLGLDREIRVCAGGATLSVLSDKNVIPPYGVNGGHPGAPNRFVVRRDGREIMPSLLPGKVSGFALLPGDIVVMQTAGGGGFGDARERDAASLSRDVEFGYVSRQAAQTIYAPCDGAIRLPLACVATPPGKRRALVCPATSAKFGLSNGALIEILMDGPSVRAWIQVDGSIGPYQLGIDADGIDLLGASNSHTVSLRRIGNGFWS